MHLLRATDKIFYKTAVLSAALAVLVCCGKHDPSALNPIGFGNAAVAETGAAGTKAGEKTFGRDFAVCGVKNAYSERQFVFPGYTVKYENQTYNYVFGQQTLKYWDTQADSYSFWGYSPADKAEVSISQYSATTKSLSPQEANAFFYSDVRNVGKDAFGDEVSLSFNRLGSQLRFGFYETLDGMGVKNLAISVHGQFIGSASYILSSEGISLNNFTTTESIDAPELPGPIGQDKKQASLTAWIPVLSPADTGLGITIESCTFTQDGTTKTLELVNPISVTIPTEYTCWAPNKDYTYIFQISSVQEDFNHIIFSFDQQVVRDWVDNGAEGIYDFQP